MKIRYAGSSVAHFGDLEPADRDAARALIRRHSATGKPTLTYVSSDPADRRRLSDGGIIVFLRIDREQGIAVVEYVCRDDD